MMVYINKMSTVVTSVKNENEKIKEQIKYECSACHNIMTYAEISKENTLKCNMCTGRVLYKLRSGGTEYSAR
jgi:DNA-directed RNA polymerase subunit RPC12/RpoP